MITEELLIELLQRIPLTLKKRKQSSFFLTLTDDIASLYNSHQTLDNYYPSVHHRIDFEDYMARKDNGFNLIEYRLDDTQIAAYEAWVKDAKPTVKTCLNYLASKSVKVSLTFSEHNESWCASLTGREGNKHNEGVTLTTWSDDGVEALMMGVFKATVIFEDGKWITRKSANRG